MRCLLCHIGEKIVEKLRVDRSRQPRCSNRPNGTEQEMSTTSPETAGRRGLILLSVLLGNFASGIVFTLLSVARKTIAEDLQTSQSLVLWAFTGPTLAAAVSGPALGRLGDLLGHKRVYLAGLIGGLVTSVLVALSWNVSSLIVFRTLGATVTAAIGPSSLALIFRAYTREHRVKAMGYYSLVGAGAPVIGVVVGGPVVERFGWHAMFLGQIPFYVLAFSVAVFVLPETVRKPVVGFDWPGATMLGITTFAVLFGVNRGSAWGWSDIRIVGCFLLAPVALLLFIAIEKRAAQPLLPLTMFRRRNVVVGIGAQMLAQFSYLGAGLFLVNDLLVSERGFNLSLSSASRATLARPIVFSLFGPLAGILAVRRGERLTASIGIGLVGVSMGLLLANGSTGPLIVLIIAIAISGLGMSMSSGSLTAVVANAVPENILGVVGAAQQLLVQSGGIIGTQVMITIVAASSDESYSAAYSWAFGVALIVAIGATLLATQIRSEDRSVAKPA